MNDTAFELLPLHAVVEINPIPPETKVVPPSGGLNTKTSTVPGCAMSVAVTVATNRRLLVNVVTRNELFQLTMESRRKSLPLTVSRNWLPPAVGHGCCQRDREHDQNGQSCSRGHWVCTSGTLR